MDVTFIIAVGIFVLFISLVLVSAINYYTRTPQSEIVLELRDKTLDLFNIFFGSKGLVTSERVTVDLLRAPIVIEEKGNRNWTNEIIGVVLEYDEKCTNKQAWNNSIRTYDNRFIELPSEISYQEYCTSQWLNNSVVTFVINLTANQTKRVFVYSINNTNTTAPIHNITNITSVVGYWNFDEINGTLARDFSGNENNGTLKNGSSTCSGGTCPQRVSDLFVRAIKFDGLDDYIDTGSSSTLRPSSEITWSLWLKRTGTGIGTSPHVIRFGDNGEPFFVENGNNLQAGIKTSGGETNVFDTVTAPSAWTHYAITYNGTGLGLWRNGTLVNSSSATGTISYDNNTLTIGGDGNNEFWNGTIDDLRVFTRALNSTEISNLASTIPTVTIFPSENVTAISAEKVQSLKSRAYDEIRTVIGEGHDFRIEIREK